MGFSTIMGYMIVFIIFMSTLLLLFSVFYDYQSEVASESAQQLKRLRAQLDSQMTFSSTNYSNNRLLLYINNVGAANLNATNMDLYVDRNWVNATDYTIRILNTSIDPLLWNPGELMLTNISIPLGIGLHEAKMVSYNGITVATQFSIDFTTCNEYCVFLAYSAGSCINNPGNCNVPDTYESEGDVYCTGGPAADTCCCNP